MEQNRDRLEELRHTPVSKLLWRFFWPAFAGVIATSLYNIVDRMFIGQGVDAEALSGVTAVFPIMIIMMAFNMLFGIGGSIQLSIALGRKNHKEASDILGNVVLMVTFVSIGISIVGYFIKEPLLQWFGATDATIEYANDYLNIILLGVVFQSLGFALNNVIRSEGNARIAMYSMLITAGINIPLDALFIFVFKMGVKGAAWATFTSMASLTLWVLIHFRSKRCVVPLQWRSINFQWPIVKLIISVGMAPFFMQLANSAVQAIINRQLIVFGGDIAVGAMGIVMSVMVLVVMSVVALNMASQPIIGFNYGAKAMHRVKETLKLGLIAATLFSVGSWAVIQLFPEQIIMLFNDDNLLLRQYGVQGLRLFSLALPIIGFQVIVGSYFQSIGKAPVATFLSLLRQVFILIPLLFLLPNYFGLKGIWIAGPIADSVAAIVCFVLIYREWHTTLSLQESS